MFGDRRGGLFAKTNLISETNGLHIRETNGLTKCPPGSHEGVRKVQERINKSFWGGIDKCLGIGGWDFSRKQI